MTTKEEKAILEEILKIGISGDSENAYWVLKTFIERLPTEALVLKFSLKSLHSVLEKLSKKWEKQITKSTKR